MAHRREASTSSTSITTSTNELAHFHGFQYVPEVTRDGAGFQGSWGTMRADLARAGWQNGQPVFQDGRWTSYYLHGHLNSDPSFAPGYAESHGRSPYDYTLGCVGTPEEHVLNWLSSAKSQGAYPIVPTSVH